MKTETLVLGDKTGGSATSTRFCPHMGRLPSTSVVLADQQRTLLATRLTTAAILITSGLGAFIIRDLFVGLRETGGWATLVPHLVVTVIVAVLTALLIQRGGSWSFERLRMYEVAVFGLTAAGLAWLQWGLVRFWPPEELLVNAAAFPARATVPWILLIQIYGLFIPNTGRRAAAMIAPMALIPVIVALVAGLQEPVVQQYLSAGGGSAMVLWLAIASAAAIYGSHRFSTMSRETFDARTLGLYTLRQKLGEGGMGEVYLAEHQLLKRPCAIKLVRAEKASDPKSIARFEAEVQSTARLTHPNTIEIFDYGITEDDTFFYVMEFLPGMNLDEIVSRFGPLPPERVVYLMRQVCSALAEAHAAGLVHRDIKPGNIFAAERGGIYDVVKVLDFGLVKSFESNDQSANLTLEGTFVGSPLYAPPECTVGSGSFDGRSDIYSLGATAYQLLTGEPVFKDNNLLKVVFAHANQSPAPASSLNSGIPAELNTIVMRCLEKHPDDRFADVVELEEALGQVPLQMTWTQQSARQWWTEKQTATGRATLPGADTVTQIVSADTG